MAAAAVAGGGLSSIFSVSSMATHGVIMLGSMFLLSATGVDVYGILHTSLQPIVDTAVAGLTL